MLIAGGGEITPRRNTSRPLLLFRFVTPRQLLAALGGFALPCYVPVRWLQIGRADYLPEDTLFAIRREGDLLHLTFNKDAPMPREQVSGLRLELAATKNAPTDVQ